LGGSHQLKLILDNGVITDSTIIDLLGQDITHMPTPGLIFSFAMVTTVF